MAWQNDTTHARFAGATSRVAHPRVVDVDAVCLFRLAGRGLPPVAVYISSFAQFCPVSCCFYS